MSRRHSSQTATPTEKDGVVVKIGTAAIAFAAGWAAQKVVKIAWKTATGNKAPTNLEDPELPLVQAVAFAAVSAGVGVLAQRVASRQGKQLIIHLVEQRKA